MNESSANFVARFCAIQSNNWNSQYGRTDERTDRRQNGSGKNIKKNQRTIHSQTNSFATNEGYFHTQKEMRAVFIAK